VPLGCVLMLITLAALRTRHRAGNVSPRNPHAFSRALCCACCGVSPAVSARASRVARGPGV